MEQKPKFVYIDEVGGRVIIKEVVEESAERPLFGINRLEEVFYEVRRYATPQGVIRIVSVRNLKTGKLKVKLVHEKYGLRYQSPEVEYADELAYGESLAVFDHRIRPILQEFIVMHEAQIKQKIEEALDGKVL